MRQYIPTYKWRPVKDTKEAKLLKRTAYLLASRYDTEMEWIFRLLRGTLFRAESLAEITTNKGIKKYDHEESVLNDADLYSQFMPSIFEFLALLGARRAKSILGVIDAEPDDKDRKYFKKGSERKASEIDEEPLTAKEAKALQAVTQNRFLIDTLFNVIPPPIIDTELDDEEDQDRDHHSLLTEFRDHLISQKDEMINGSGKALRPFEPYPWFDKAFATGVDVETVVLSKGLLAPRSSSGTRTERFIKTEKERLECLANEQLDIVLDFKEEVPRGFRSSITDRSSVINKRKPKALSVDNEVKKAEIRLREKLFALRIELIDFIRHYLEGTTGKEPVEALTERMSDLFSREEAQAIIGKKEKYFGLPAGTNYRHLDALTFQRLLRTATFLPIIETSHLKRLMKDTKTIFDYSLDIEGPHHLSFSYAELLHLIKPAEVEQILPTLSIVVQRFGEMEKRAYSSFLKVMRIEKSVLLADPVKIEIDSFAKKIADRTDVVIPYLKEILNPNIEEKPRNRVGIFTEGFREYHPINKSLGVIRFTALQAKVVEALYEAHESVIGGEIKRLTLVDKIYPVDEAAAIRARHGKKVTRADGTQSPYKYEWRLEKTIIKDTHPAWRLGLVKLGNKIGDDKSYRLDLEFEAKEPKS